MILNSLDLIQITRDRIIVGFSTLPTLYDWLNTIILILIYGLIALPLGFWSNFLQLNVQFSGTVAAKIIATSLIAPAILEELFFRVIILPLPSENVTVKILLITSTISLILFVIYHPVNGITFFPSGKETFFNPVFLCLATLLGLICTVSYLQSGSIWIPVTIHWIVVVIWLLFLGGREKLKML
ncbi:MAG: hypothetical protein Tsb0014_42320 [Pleurocapsa sp.]